MFGFFAFAGLGVFWVVLIALVKFERGWVGLTPAQLGVIRLRVAMLRMTWAVGEALIPGFVAMGEAFIATGKQVARLLEVSQGDK